jgi:HD-GYP domain-containing protein (c-di-GMP phosphodiesterase class II)
MEGLRLNKRGSYLEKASKHAEKLMLIAKGDGMEVMIEYILPGEVFIVSPGAETVLGAGDSFTARGLKATAHFRTTNFVTMLHLSTRPVFSMLSDEIAEVARISNSVEEKDIYTFNHDVRLREYAIKIGEKLCISKEKLGSLIFAALYHDVGKINVSREILNKPGPLTSEEFSCIKRHPTDGRRILERTHLKNIGLIVEQHHERLDGSGYPHVLRSDAIVYEAKIIAIADCFDALTSDRAYRPATSCTTAMAELKRESGTRLDGLMVEALEGILKEEGKL